MTQQLGFQFPTPWWVVEKYTMTPLREVSWREENWKLLELASSISHKKSGQYCPRIAWAVFSELIDKGRGPWAGERLIL